MSEENKPAETTIVKVPIQRNESGLMLTNFDEAWRCSVAIVKSGMAPKGYTTAEQVFVAIQHGAEIGLKPLQAVHSIAVINGRATVWGDAVPGLLLASGLLEDMEEWVDDSGTAHCILKRKGISTPIERTFSTEDAKKAGLLGKAGPWTQYERRMKAMRARSWAARDGFADVLRGLQIREEVQDYATPPQARPTVTLTPDGRLESEPVASLPAPSEDVQDVESEPVLLVNEKGELF